ncbi:MAG: aminomethyl-transferring glycine dehydrogenase subunit GcvPA [Chitinispirillales bacterium]|jgi:glycine dehydrogenase subunit 1|nr:aminomethyl-transferring glycine dehydrogenase subunit GcvPA [Chitinispirillales bacterium]
MSYIPVTPEQQREMLLKCGVSSIEELFKDIPAQLVPAEFSLPKGLSELEAVAKLEKLASQNNSKMISFLGAGFYDHFIPAAVDALISRSEFYTAYTPYQSEISQGTLQAIYEYQSHICRLTGMDISNASLYDGGTAVFEACQMAISATGRRRIIVDKGVNPIYRKMLRTHIANLNVELIEHNVFSDGSLSRIALKEIISENVAAAVLQNPNFFGIIDDHSDIVVECKKYGVIAIQAVYPIALSLLKSPAEQGFDIAIGEGQSLGIPLSFGGPYLGFIGARKELARKMPGRIAAKTEDKNGNEGFVLSLQAREQHIRREKATSNICSNEALCALRAHIYLSLMGKEGMKSAASLCHSKAMYCRRRIGSIEQVNMTDSRMFNEFIIELPINAGECAKLMLERGFIAGLPLSQYYKGEIGPNSKGENSADNLLLVTVTEKRTKQQIDDFVKNLEEVICR